ncbi:MAG: ABC transporter substrate-binding protein [Desulfobacula sp.]|jgi:branched-chain amino acid transport system substrate-binding protein|uniref:ABC transporter substrate-binding protein n=2 Tax=Desulfobacula sp. TaxID=2593537 RepID=UPI001D5F5B8B|nr:ABC transporter substrate-binding protein [Desulfobacula sp.]MBT7713920.1 ABC transporter substrate-binding protein [Deltaproteobacteria bacterium]MBT3487797.1 ABC transporter substrate-binding protein [Desulfobacula sp.]MBT3807720.1 ABC transporter substrate-binding protein [Desulfobacula sp.]MBT4201205.1 ABC transporter substrate-binding protein [Desulfobacula sp.]
MKKSILLTTLIFILTVFLLPLGAMAADTIKLGVVTPMSTGDFRSGKINVQTVELAVEQINAQGGVLGKKLEVVTADDEGKPAAGVIALKRMIAKEKISAVVGLWHSSVAVAQEKVATQMQVPMMLHYSWTDDLTAGHSDYVYRVGPFNAEIAQLALPYIDKNYKNIAILYETNAFGSGFANYLEKIAKAKGLNVYSIGYPQEATDLKPQLLQLKAKSPKPELLVIAAVYEATNLIPKQALEIGLAPEMQILCSWDWPTYPAFQEILGEKGVGVTYATFESDKLKLSPLGEKFKKAYKAKYDVDPPVFALFLYDEVMILAETMKRIKSSDPKDVAAGLKDTKFEGTTGLITFERKEGPGPVWNQWMGHQLFINKLTAVEGKSYKREQIYP